MQRSTKIAKVAELRAQLEGATVVVIVEPFGIDGPKADELRAAMRAVGARYVLCKNNLVRRALDGIESAAIGDLVAGPTALVVSSCEEPEALLRELFGYLRGDFVVPTSRYHSTRPAGGQRYSDAPRPRPGARLTIKGAWMYGALWAPEHVRRVAEMPARDVLRAQLVQTLLAPQRRALRVLREAGGARMLRALSARQQTLSSATPSPGGTSAQVPYALVAPR